MKYYTITILFLSISVFPQGERYTKGAENGYAWLAMDNPTLHYSVSKENYLGSILERIKLTKEKHPEITSLNCKKDIEKLSIQTKPDKISLNDIVIEIDKFYSEEVNLVIPILFAYCYTIKKLAGVSAEDLRTYKDEVLLFCYK